MCPGFNMRMDLLLVLFLVLWDGRAALIRAEEVSKAVEGGNITVGCTFSFSGTKKIFCKNDCNKEDILVETSGNSGSSGRYSIKYEGKSGLTSDVMYVTITNVTSSDSGRYRCVLDRWTFDSKHEFRIKVTKGTTTLNPINTLKPSDIPSSFTVKTSAHMPSFTSVSTTELSVNQAPVSSEQSTPAPSAAPSATGAPLYVGLSLVVILILFSVALLVMCWNKRTNKPKEPPMNTVYALPETNRLYEEISDYTVQSTPRPVKVSTVYTSASFNKSAGDRTSEIYSLATEPSEQNQVESPTSVVHYSDVDFSNSSAPLCPTDQQQAISTENNLYSTASLPQL